MIIEKIKVKYDNFSLNVDKLNIEDNAVNLIIGESGCGKTSLAKVLSGYINNYSEKILLDNRAVDNNYLFDNVEYLPTNQVFINNFTVFDTIVFKGKSYYKKDELNLLIDDYLKELNLIDKRNTKVKYLSGGEKQRLAVICALLTNKNIIIFDEPNKDLDEINSQKVFDLLLKIKDKTIIIIAHNYDYIKDKTSNIIEIKDGLLEKKESYNYISCNNNLVQKRNRRIIIKDDLKANISIPVLKLISYILLFFISFLLVSSSFFITNISNEKKYNNEKNVFTGYKYNLEILSTDKKVSVEELKEIAKDYNYEEIIYNYTSINSTMPIPSKLNLFSGRCIENDDEILLALNPSNYYTNKDKYDNIIGQSREIIFWHGFSVNSLSETKEFKVVGIANSNYNVYSDTMYFCSKNTYEKYCSLDLSSQYRFSTENQNYKGKISFKNITIDDTIPDYTLSYKNYNDNNVVYNVSCYEYNQEFSFDFIEGDETLKMNQKTYDDLFDDEISIRTLSCFKSKNDINKMKKALDKEGIVYNDLSFYTYECNIFLIALSIIITIVLSIGLLSLVNKTYKNKYSYYCFCKIKRTEVIVSDVVINVGILLLCSVIYILIINGIFINKQNDNIKNYYLFSYLSIENCVLYIIAFSVIILLVSISLNLIKSNKKNA